MYVQALEKQFPKDAYEVKSRACFHFAPSDGNSTPKLQIEVQSDLCKDWHLVVENPGSREVINVILVTCHVHKLISSTTYIINYRKLNAIMLVASHSSLFPLIAFAVNLLCYIVQ